MELYGAGRIRGSLHLYIGEEAVAVGAIRALAPDDAVVATYREHGHVLVRGVTAGAIMAEMYGKVERCSRERGDRGLPAQQLLDDAGSERRLPPGALDGSRLSEERPAEVAQGVRGGGGADGERQAGMGDDLVVGESLSVDLCVEEARQDVVAGSTAPCRERRGDDAGELGGRGAGALGVDGKGEEPASECPLALLGGDGQAELAADREVREHVGELRDERLLDELRDGARTEG